MVIDVKINKRIIAHFMASLTYYNPIIANTIKSITVIFVFQYESVVSVTINFISVNFSAIIERLVV
jgi:hypothetical protein